MSDRNLFKESLEQTRNIWDRPGTRPEVRKNFADVIDCGTPALGWEVYASENEEKRCYRRCKSRFCPSCGYRATLYWLEVLDAILPDIPFRGIIPTMPCELWPIFRTNRHLLHDLPALAAAVVQQWMSMKYGAKVLIMVVPHTFGGDLKFNPHLHMLVSIGGLQKGTGRWIPELHLSNKAKKALMNMWRYAVITHLRRALEAGVLKSNVQAHEVRRLLSSAYKNERHREWVVLHDDTVSKEHFTRYAARYVRRPPIASWRILRVANGKVQFVAKDTRGRAMFPTWRSLPDFVRLLAPHVPDRYRHGIRYFGLLAPRARNLTYSAIFLLLGQVQRPRPRRLDWRSSLKKYFGFDPLIDSHGQEMSWVRRERLIAR